MRFLISHSCRGLSDLHLTFVTRIPNVADKSVTVSSSLLHKLFVRPGHDKFIVFSLTEYRYQHSFLIWPFFLPLSESLHVRSNGKELQVVSCGWLV